MNLETKITIYKFTPQVFTLTPEFVEGDPVFYLLFCITKIRIIFVIQNKMYFYF